MNELETLWRGARALLFDFDGVLAHSEPWFHRATNEAFAPWGVSVSEPDYWRYWASMGEGVAGHLRRHGITGVDAGEVARRKEAASQTLCEAGRVPLFPATAALLRRLLDGTEPGARPFVIASNSPRRIVETVLRLGQAPVPTIVGGDGLPTKPAPDIFLRALDTLGVSAGEALVFEDSEKGIRAARAAGIPAVWVQNELNRDLELRADAVLDDIAGLLGLLDGGGR